MFGNLWKRTKAVASMYTGTFIVVMILNQLLFFGFCLNPICLVAAMPHVLFITVLIGSWLNKVNNWGKGDADNVNSTATNSAQGEPDRPETSVGKTIKNALDTATAGMEKFNKKLDVFNVTMGARSVYLKEKEFVECWLSVSEGKLEIQREKENDPKFAKIYDELSDKFDQCDDGTSSVDGSPPEVEEVASFVLPAGYEDAENIEDIKAKVAGIIAAHSNFLTEVKKKLDRDPDLMAVFEEEMEKSGGGKILAHIKAIQTEGVKNKKPTVIIPRRISKSKPRASLHGPKAHRLNGNWKGGFACDIHTLSSRHLGVDEHGHDKWDNTRSEMGQLIYQLKYSNDFSTIPQIIDRLCDQITIEGFDCIIPAPASKKRRLQPVDAISQALGKQRHIPVLVGFLSKTGNLELKGMDDPIQRANALRSSIKVVGEEDISGKKVLLLDDLYRSGATLNACCQVLREEELVGEIWVLTMTKTRRNK